MISISLSYTTYNVRAETFNTSGWFDGKQAPNTYYTLSGVTALNFNKAIDNDTVTGYGFGSAATVTLATPITADKVNVLANGSGTIVFNYSDGTKVNAGFSIANPTFTLDNTKTIKSFQIWPGWTIYDFDINSISDFYITSISPSSGRIDVPLDTTIKAYFNKTVDSIGNLKLYDSNNNLISGTCIKTNNIVEFVPSANFNFDTSYTYEISGFKDNLGNENPFISSTFTTIKDNTPIYVKDIKPPPDSVNVPVDTKVIIEFNKTNIDPSSISNVKIIGVNTTSELNNGIITLTITEPLAFETEYTINISGVKDTNGNGMASPISVKFSTIKDTTGLILKGYKPPSGIYPLDTVFDFYFNKNVDSSTLKYTLVDSDGNTVATNINTVGSKITFSPLLLSGKKYTFTFLEIKDFNGNLYDTPVTINFETMVSSGVKDFDDITSTNLKLFSTAKDGGMNILMLAISCGLIFIGAKWLWRKLNMWLIGYKYENDSNYRAWLEGDNDDTNYNKNKKY